ncbi:hypothetical protein QBC38DRAFT_521780 [Podospora fimiseda]|uniref:DUF8021 domain-containing protein n=1 Tax=Podospora fimiseda TaxID=252190 RepID=A0AAN6YLR3_9PEZI|nr:hypothetical protein QBC38DRAFT_521780 [Podospora fimiseda]
MLSLLTLTLVLTTPSTSQTTPTCSKFSLQEASSRYIATQSTGSLTYLQPLLSPNTTFLENNLPLNISTSTTLTSPAHIDRNQTIYDVIQCAIFTSLTITDPISPRVIGAQIFLSPSSPPSILKIDRVHTTPGDWLFNATGTLFYSQRENWSEIPPAERDSRETIKAAADAYFDIFKDASVNVPWGTPCTRLEGGAYTGRGLPSDSCNIGVIQSYDMPNRRYVIDETVGAVSVLVEFGSIGNAPDSHLFRVEGGKLRRIHTMTYCERKPNCGYELPGGLSPRED